MRLSRFIPVAFAAMTLLPAVSSAQQVQFVGVKYPVMTLGNPFGPGIHPYVGPYEMKYTSDQQVFDIYCIDFDHAFTSTAYNARILSFADAVNSSLSFNGVDNFTALKRVLGSTSMYNPGVTAADFQYRLGVEAYLASGFGNTPNSEWDERHFAMWGIFSSNVTPYVNDGVNNDATILGNAEATYGSFDPSGWSIILDERAWDTVDGGVYEQGVIAQVSTVPEPGTYALVGVGMIVLAGAARRRNRASRQSIAGNTQLV